MIKKVIIHITKNQKSFSALDFFLNMPQSKVALNVGKDPSKLLGRENVSFHFSQSPQDKNIPFKQIKETEDDTKPQNQEVQTIQVSYEEFKKMKELLKELKSQISNLQQESIPSKPQQSSNPTQNTSSKVSQDLKNKLTEFSKKSSALQQQNQSQQLFFKSVQQQLSFELIKLNSKQQFTELVNIYMNKFFTLKNTLDGENLQQSNEFLEHLKLLYLIFFRYCSLQNAKFDDSLIRNLALQISKHINFFEENEVEKFVSILNDHSKPLPSQNSNNSFLHNQKSSEQFISRMRQNLLNDNKVFNYQSKKYMNSQILSLISSFLLVDQGIYSKIPLECFDLKTDLKKQSSEESMKLLYNPLNLSNLLINSIRFCGSRQVQNKFYYLLSLCLEIKEKDFQTQEYKGESLKVQDSLNGIDFEGYQQMQYQAVIHYFDHIPWIDKKNLGTISEQNLLSGLMKKQNYLQRFSLIQQLRICYSLLTCPAAVSLSSAHNSVIMNQLHRILVSTQGQSKLLQPKNNQSNIISDHNHEFLYYKKTAMILSQIAIQIYKNFKIAHQSSKTHSLLSQIRQLVQQILKYINVICLEKTEIQDLWKQENDGKDKQAEKLILNLSSFEFIVNLNIISKWNVQLSGDPLMQDKNVELLKNLINCYLLGLKRTVADFGMLSKERKLQLADEFVIIILVGKQHNIIRKSIQYCLTESDQSLTYTSLLKQTIGKDQSHKYFQQYIKICQQFKI